MWRALLVPNAQAVRCFTIVAAQCSHNAKKDGETGWWSWLEWKEKHTHTLHCLNYQVEKNRNDYWIPRQLQLRQTAISDGHVVQIDYGGEMGMKLKNNSNQRTLKGGLFKRERGESNSGDTQGAAGEATRRYWQGDWQVMIGSCTWCLRVSGQEQEQLRWHSEVVEIPSMT